MHEPDLVRRVERRRDLLDDLHRSRGLHRTVGKNVFEVLASISRMSTYSRPSISPKLWMDYMRVSQPRRGECLVPKPLLKRGVCGQLRRQNLDRDDSPGGGVGTPATPHPCRRGRLTRRGAFAEGRAPHYASCRRWQTSGFTVFTIGKPPGPVLEIEPAVGIPQPTRRDRIPNSTPPILCKVGAR